MFRDSVVRILTKCTEPYVHRQFSLRCWWSAVLGAERNENVGFISYDNREVWISLLQLVSPLSIPSGVVFRLKMSGFWGIMLL